MRYDKRRQRVYIAGWRIHHGFTGMILAAIGAALMAHDRRDWRKWISGR